MTAVTVPGSKSITNRALLMAALSDGECVLKGCMAGGDGEQFLSCLKQLGFKTEESIDETAAIVKNKTIKICGCGGEIPAYNAEVYVGSAGTAARFIAAMAAFSKGRYHLDASEQMKKRPMKDLTDACMEAGAKISFDEREGYFPMTIEGAGEIPGSLSVNIDKSSQFLSALMIAAGAGRRECRIEVEGSHGLAYVDMTARMMREFGVDAVRENNAYLINGKGYRAIDYVIEPDMSAAAYFHAASLLTGKEISVYGEHEDMLQGDREFAKLLDGMNAGDGHIRGGMTVDMSAMSDQALTLAVLSAYADAPVTIKGIGHIRLQECDRIAAIRENLKRMGIETEEFEDGVRINPGEPHGAEIKTFEDHRVAMSFALAGLVTEGIVIDDPACVGKTFPEYFEVLKSIR